MTVDRAEPPSTETLAEARRAIEAILLVANDPTPEPLLAQLLELPVDLVGAMCRELAAEYDSQGRGFQLAAVAGGWRYQTHPDVHPYVERYALEGIPNRLSSAALETLAIVAYKQPISRGQVGAIRGVNADGVLRTLIQRGYVSEIGRDDGPGQAALFGTTDFFLETLGLMSAEDLPALGEFVPSAEVLEALEQTLKIEAAPPVDLTPTGGSGNGSGGPGGVAADNGGFGSGAVENGGVGSGAVESGAVESGGVGSGTVENGTVENGAVVSGGFGSGAVENGAVESGGVGSGAVENGAVESGGIGTGGAGHGELDTDEAGTAGPDGA